MRNTVVGLLAFGNRGNCQSIFEDFSEYDGVRIPPERRTRGRALGAQQYNSSGRVADTT